MKRKSQCEEESDNKLLRMSETAVLDTDMESNHVVLGNARSFAFRLTDITAKKNLLASARRIAFEKDPKQKSTKLKFSAGAYLKAVLPTILQRKKTL